MFGTWVVKNQEKETSWKTSTSRDLVVPNSEFMATVGKRPSIHFTSNWMERFWMVPSPPTRWSWPRRTKILPKHFGLLPCMMLLFVSGGCFFYFFLPSGYISIIYEPPKFGDFVFSQAPNTSANPRMVLHNSWWPIRWSVTWWTVPCCLSWRNPLMALWHFTFHPAHLEQTWNPIGYQHLQVLSTWSCDSICPKKILLMVPGSNRNCCCSEGHPNISRGWMSHSCCKVKMEWINFPQRRDRFRAPEIVSVKKEKRWGQKRLLWRSEVCFDDLGDVFPQQI